MVCCQKSRRTKTGLRPVRTGSLRVVRSNHHESSKPKCRPGGSAVQTVNFRQQIDSQAIRLLLGRALDQMRISRVFHVLAVCSWNAAGGHTVHREMHVAAGLCQSGTLSELGSRHVQRSWGPAPLPGVRRSMPKTVFQTYIHDDHAGPSPNCKEFLPGFQRTFAMTRLGKPRRSMLGTMAPNCLFSTLKHPAHRADYTHGGLYFDIKFAFRDTFDRLLQLRAGAWDSVHLDECKRLGLCPMHPALSWASTRSWP